MYKINEFKDDTGKTCFCFIELFDYKHFEELLSEIKIKLHPNSVESIQDNVFWFSSTKETKIQKDELDMRLILDKTETIYLMLASKNDESAVSKFKNFVDIISGSQ